MNPNGEQLSFFVSCAALRICIAWCHLFVAYSLLSPYLSYHACFLHSSFGAFFTEFYLLPAPCLYYACYVRRYIACLLTCSHEPDRPFYFSSSFHFVPCLSSYLFLSPAGLVLGLDHSHYRSRRISFSLLLTAPYIRPQKTGLDWIISAFCYIPGLLFTLSFLFFYHLSRSIICERRLGLRWIS